MRYLERCFIRRRQVWILLAVGALSFPNLSLAQDESTKYPNPHKSAESVHGDRVSKLKLTPQQVQAVQLLNTSRTEAAGLQPEARTYVLRMVANAYRSFEPQKESKLLHDAFLASLAIESAPADEACDDTDACRMKTLLQRQILERLAEKSPEDAKGLLLRAVPGVRNSIRLRIVDYYLDHKQLEKARVLISELSGQDYPYKAAGQLILALPDGRSADRLAIFSEALNNFQQSPSLGFANDLPMMIVDTWQHLPPALILSAIETILAEAKSDSHADMHMAMASKEGKGISLNSLYELRLFQLLPILQELDPSRAEDLLRDNPPIRLDLQKYPAGMQSVNPMGEPNVGIALARSGDGTGSPSLQSRLQGTTEIEGRLNAISIEAEKDPKQALSDALTLPLSGGFQHDSCARLSALESVARLAARKDKFVAETALDEATKLAEQLPPRQGRKLANAMDVYTQLGDEEGAEKALNVLLKIAQNLYAIDSNPSDPNQVFKGMWPSTVLWRRCVEFSVKLSPNLAKSIISDLSDPEIAALQRVAYASSLLGASTGPWQIAEKNERSGNHFRTFQD